MEASSYARQPLAQRASLIGSGNRSFKVITEMGHHSGYATNSGITSPFAQNVATTIRDSREKEKKEISDLNDRLATYIEKVRFLEAQNRKIQTDLKGLQNKKGKDTENIRQMFESELNEAKKLIAETNRHRDQAVQELTDLNKEVTAMMKKLSDATRDRAVDNDKLAAILHRLSTIDSEVKFYQRRIESVDEEIRRIKNENNGLLTQLQRFRTDLDQETLNRIDQQNQVQTLLEETEFLRRLHEQELRDLRAMASRDTTNENREYFKNELASAIRDIRQEYDQIVNLNRNDVESWYRLKVQEIQTQSARQNMEKGYQQEEVKRLRVQLGDLRAKLADLESKNNLLQGTIQQLHGQIEDDQQNYEQSLNDRDKQIRKVREECQGLMVELQMLLDTKQSLDAEIALYRRMLDGEGNISGLKQVLDQSSQSHTGTAVLRLEMPSSSRVDSPTSQRSSFQRSAKGNVAIQDISPDGHFIVLQNTHRAKDEKLSEWRLKRQVTGNPEVTFTFPKKFVLKAGKQMRIYARGCGANLPPDQLVDDSIISFGVGLNARTILTNKDGEERATYIQKVV
ncbi:hypothetical protein M3Y95_00914300 [Aphelenchoides besseyi]|nr:hypothetical protein M3Y95_00914300 [Aphelenchoides besseyi]